MPRLNDRSWTVILASFACLAVVRPAEAQLSYETLHVFDGSHGAQPMGPMVQLNGWIYGVTAGGPSPVGSTVFRFKVQDPAGTFQTLWESIANGDGGAGDIDVGGLTLAGDGNLYFEADDTHNGCGEPGVVWKVTTNPAPPPIDPDTPPTVTLFQDFCPPPPLPSSPLTRPRPGLTVGADGALYGASVLGGANGTGGVYRLALNGTLSGAASFPATFQQFASNSQLVTGTDGRLYGTQQNGLVYRVDPTTSAVDVLHYFGPGPAPVGRLLEVPALPGQDIAFVGVTNAGGTNGYGMIYRIDVKAGVLPATFAKLHDGDATPGGAAGFAAGLVRDASGNLYGTTLGGAPPVVYRIDSNGTFAIVFPFGYAGPVGQQDAIGSRAPLLLADDGNIYGTTLLHSVGPPPVLALGSVFRLKPPSAPTVVTGAASGIGPFAATLNGTANPKNLAAIGYLQWGLTTFYGSTTPSQSLGSGGAMVAIGGGSLISLACNATYHFRAVAMNSVGRTNASDGTFSTSACPPPTVVTGIATPIDVTTATVNGTATPNGTPTSAQFQYGLTIGYGAATPVQFLGSSMGAVPIGGGELAGLTCGTQYHFRVVAGNTGGITLGGDATFTTSSGPGCAFNDDPLTSALSVIKAVHVIELRTRIDTQRVRYGLQPFGWSDPALTASVTPVRAQHILDLRTALNAAYVAAGQMPPTYSDSGLTAGTGIKVVHINELRTAVVALESLP